MSRRTTPQETSVDHLDKHHPRVGEIAAGPVGPLAVRLESTHVTAYSTCMATMEQRVRRLVC